jgi:hypothetical protein
MGLSLLGRSGGAIGSCRIAVRAPPLRRRDPPTKPGVAKMLVGAANRKGERILQRRLCPGDDVVKLGEEGDSPSTTTADTINRIVGVGGAV